MANIIKLHLEVKANNKQELDIETMQWLLAHFAQDEELDIEGTIILEIEGEGVDALYFSVE